MHRLGLERSIVDQDAYDRTVRRFREAGIVMPRFAELADPSRLPAETRGRLDRIEPDAPHPLNLFRAHWFNASDRRGTVAVPVTWCCRRRSPGCGRRSSSRSATAFP